MGKEESNKKSRKRALVSEAVGSQTVQFVSVGQTLSERYKLVEELGRGAMGIVFKAEDELLEGMEVAIKVLPPELANDKRSKKRLRKETLSAIKLSHPNILRINGFQEDGSIPFIVMEYLEGHTVEDEAVDREEEVLEVDEVLEIAKAVCEALDYAHECGIVHRDIKPTNLIYHKHNDRHIVKVADFGIAYQIKNSVTRLTGFESSGTLYYVAPEQLRGEKPRTESDQYSLAATLYELLSGDPPFHGAGLSQQVLSVKPKPIEGVPEHVNEALLRALSKKPEERFPSCGDFYAALNAEFVGTAPAEEKPVVEEKVEEPELTIPAVSVEEEVEQEKEKEEEEQNSSIESLGLSVPKTSIYDEEASEPEESIDVSEQLGKICVKTNVGNTTCALVYYIEGRKQTKYLQLPVEGVWYEFKRLDFRSYTLLFEAEGFISKEVDVKLSENNQVIQQSVELESDGVCVGKEEDGPNVLRIVLLLILLGLLIVMFVQSPGSRVKQSRPKQTKRRVVRNPRFRNSSPSSTPVREVPRLGKLIFDVQPTSAKVYIDGFFVAPDKWNGLPREKGSYKVTAKLAGHYDEVQRVYLNAGETRTVRLRFAAKEVEKKRPEPIRSPPAPTRAPTPAPRPSNLFEGKKLVNRYQMAQVLSRFLIQKGLARRTSNHGLSDVDGKYAEAVAITTGAKLLEGYDGKFHGRKLVNRYQMAVIIHELLTKLGQRPRGNKGASAFSDVPRNHWAYAAISHVTELEILQGYDGKFHGPRLLNRFQMAVVMNKAANRVGLARTEQAVRFTDVPRTHWAYDSIIALSEMSLLKSDDMDGIN